MRYFILLILSGFILVSACKTNQNGVKSQSAEKKNNNKQINYFRVEKPVDKSYVDPVKPVEYELAGEVEGKLVDSVILIAEGKVIKSLKKDELKTTLDLRGHNPGEYRLLTRIYYSDSSLENHSTRLRILSGIEPVEYTFRVIKTFPHDIGAYTQGLEYVGGYIYEGTGNNGESSIRKVDLESGEILKYRDLSADFFGEGITLLNGKIYQVTYRKQVGFVYDEKSFEPLRRIYYQNREGWGLCNNGTHILMSDGSHVISYMDTTYFSAEKTISVFDNKSEVSLLNELELINGTLYANRYTTNEIVMIEPETGRVTGRIDMTGILDPADRHPRIDYFNGIAYDSKNKRIFVTGKYWNKMYQVEFIRK